MRCSRARTVATSSPMPCGSPSGLGSGQPTGPLLKSQVLAVIGSANGFSVAIGGNSMTLTVAGQGLGYRVAVIVMTVVGVLVGFRPEGGMIGAALAFGVMLTFGFALSWFGVALGAFVRTPEAMQGIIFMTIFPLTFASSAFVPTDTMPDWLRVFAEHQPLTLVINTVRSFMLTGGGGPDAVPALVWSVGMLAVFFPLGLWLYRRRTSQ